MSNLINIYNDSESAIIIDESTTSLTSVEKFPTLGESPFNSLNPSTQGSLDAAALQNHFFIELNIFDEDNNFIVTLNSAKPLLLQPSTNKFYFDEYHLHQSVYMVGSKHVATPHETLELVRQNHFVPYPIENRIYQDDYVSTDKIFAIKTSEIFEILKKLRNYNLEKDSNFIMSYAVFQDAFLLTRRLFAGGNTTQ
jgi:hypothetical protein|tara:strand:+ start:300 stop:887 length:588 start_codon:yes stop_codon:yes gene_type:complete